MGYCKEVLEDSKEMLGETLGEALGLAGARARAR